MGSLVTLFNYKTKYFRGCIETFNNNSEFLCERRVSILLAKVIRRFTSKID